MTFIELFAGIGGFRLGIGSKAKCVYANEWDKYAAQIYEKNFKEKPNTRSITDVRADEIPDHDLLVGGFPCQAFSIAGKRGGFEDTRGTLFFEIASQPFLTWGMFANGRYLTARTSEYRKTAKECSLSDILEDKVDSKYFLSEKMVNSLMVKSEKFQGEFQLTPKKGISPTIRANYYKMGRTDCYLQTD